MTREIKFRAWDKNARQMSYSFTLTELTRYEHIFERKFPAFLAKFKTLIWMQYTGLKDKHGKEIYEGDYLKHDLWGIDEVIWDNESACFRGKSKKHDITLAHHQLQRSRVIGNIYENSELLKNK